MPEQDFNDKVLDSILPMPKGTAPKTEDYIAGPQPSLRDYMGTGSNVLGMGASGAQLGAMLGPLGAAGGGVLGAGIGAMLPPSETPGTDAGLTAAELLAPGIKFLPKNRWGRIARDVGAAGLGSLIGAEGDKAMGFQKETPWGTVGIYSAMSTPGAIVGSLAAKTTGASQAADRLAAQNYGKAPLSFSETTGLLPGFEQMMTAGTSGQKALGVEQNAFARSAMQKIIDAPLENSMDVLMQGRDLKGEARKVMVDWRNTWKKANTETVTSEVPSYMGADGKTVMETVTTSNPPSKVNYDDFAQKMGFVGDEKDAFFRALKVDPDQFIDALIPKGENQVKGLVKLRALMKVFDGKPEAGQLGQAVAMRYLRSPMENGEAVTASALSKRINLALGSPTEPGHLVAALGPDRAAALKDLAEVLDTAAPLDKVAGDGVSAQKRGGSYLFNKVAFTAASGGAAGLAGGNGLNMGNLLIGTGIGSIVAIGVPTMVGMMMTNPKLGATLKAAAKGDSQAATRILRTIGSSVRSESDRDGVSASDFTPEAGVSRLRGLFAPK